MASRPIEDTTTDGEEDTTAEEGSLRLVLPEEGSGESPTGSAAAAELARAHTRGEPFRAAILKALREAPTGPERDTVTRHFEAGVKHHRRLDLDPAMSAYRAALRGWPGHPGANYRLAAALALRGEADDALYHLKVLAHIGGQAAARHLKEARMEADFEGLVDDPRFRILTGYSPVGVGAVDRETATRWARTLLEAHIPADVITMPAPDGGATTLWVSGDDPLASTVAREVHGVMRGQAKRELLRDAPSEHLVVLWVGQAGGGRSSGRKASFEEVTDFVEVDLTAEHDGTLEELRLWKTGFFRWVRIESSGIREERTGRYLLDDGEISLDFKRVREQLGEDGRSQTEQGRRETHQLRVEGDTLLVGKVSFHPAR